MAYWTRQNGWQTYSLPTGYRTNYSAAEFAENYPYTDANAFAGSYPYKNANDFAAQYPDNRPTSRTIWFRLNNKGNAIVATSESPQSGSEWRARTISGTGGSVRDQLGNALFSKSNDSLNGNLRNIIQEYASAAQQNSQAAGQRQNAANVYNQSQNANRQREADSYNNRQNTNRQNTANAYNQTYSNLNAKNETINTWSSSVAKSFANVSEGKYANTLNNLNTSALEDLKSKGLLAADEYNKYVNTAVDSFDSFYLTDKVKPWDATKLGAQPPTGGFDPEYYRLNTEGGVAANDEWNAAQSSVYVNGRYLPDLDITGRYTKDTYLQWYYTTQGKASGERGNTAETAGLPEEYKELFTDADYQLYRDKVLGLADRFDNIKDWADAQDPNVLNAWYASLPSGQKAEYDAGTLAVPTLDFIPDRLRNQVKMTKGTTILEGELSTVLGEKEKQQQQMFGALTQDSLRQAAAELQKQKLKEQQFDFYRGLPGFNEVMTVNESIANSLLGDTGIGGIFGWMGDTGKVQESLEKSLGSATGVPSRSNAVYNWQKWFDDQLLPRYQEGATITDPLDESIVYTLDAEFAKDYIDRYLKPRFDTSRSMSEFVSYMDVKQNEQNIFQTQSALDSLKDIADLRSKAYLDNIKSTAPLNFNAEFYLNPQGNFSEDDPKYQTYLKQKDEVSSDWETAKARGDTAVVPGTDWTWNQWAYYYGLDPNDQNQFAKLHYQVKGAAAGFDPAKDLITLKDAEDYIQGTILPELANEKLNIGDITFLNFVTPEEYADKLLEGISPEGHKEEWDKLLETLGLSDAEMGITEVKQYIIDAFRTGAAKEIRESIKYLNEKKLTPTQERLGVEYIERPEDVKPIDDPNATALYKIFQSAGYQGSEDEFYKDFMPDVDRSEMELVTQATKDKGLQSSSIFSGLSSSDPFEALVSMQSIFDNEKQTTTSTKDETAPSYFNIFGDDNKEEYKSKTGQKILGEFTSLFKGFS
jgi:hypothetical protein